MLELRTIDLTYRDQDYRLTETVRSAGGSVRPAEQHRACLICPRRFRPETRCVCLPDGSGSLCLTCAIHNGVLVIQPRQWLDLRAENRNLKADMQRAADMDARRLASVAYA